MITQDSQGGKQNCREAEKKAFVGDWIGGFRNRGVQSHPKDCVEVTLSVRMRECWKKRKSQHMHKFSVGCVEFEVLIGHMGKVSRGYCTLKFGGNLEKMNL
jgi:hypothetical protein